MKTSSPNSPTLLTCQNENIDNPERIANIFNNYFDTTGDKTQAKIKQSHIKYMDYPTNENPDSFFLSSTNKEEIKPIINNPRYQQIYWNKVSKIRFQICLKLTFLNSLLTYLTFLLQQTLSQLV